MRSLVQSARLATAILLPLLAAAAESLPLRAGEEARLAVRLPGPAPAGPAAAVLICPGGGYKGLALEHEGALAAAWLAERGVVAAVLRYRLPGDGFTHPAPLLDAQRALRLLRGRAADWGIDPRRIGIMGFSAGGHLAATAATAGPEPLPAGATEDAIDRLDARPAFQILVYPCITFGPAAYGGLGVLLADPRDQALRARLSAEQRVGPGTPPAFLVHSDADAGVSPLNSVLYYQALRAHGIAAELHIYDGGGHGWGFHRRPGNVGVATWDARLEDWMRQRGLLAGEARP